MVAASLLPLGALILAHPVVIGLAAGATAFLVTGEVARRASPTLNQLFLTHLAVLLKSGEKRQITGATYLSAASLIALTLFSKEVAALALFFLALGDPAAALVGSRYGRLRISLPAFFVRTRRQSKSLEGTLTFLLVALGLATALWGAKVFDTYWPAALGALVAAVVEFLPLPADDNLSVPLASAGVMALVWVG